MGAFAEALKLEMEAAARDTLVETYRWANSSYYGEDVDLKARAEAWADDIEKAGKTLAVLEALAASHTCPTCGRSD